MKTAISIPDNLFHAADALAGQLGISRSALYSAAVADFVGRRRVEQITVRLDEVYGSIDRNKTTGQPRVPRADVW